MMKFQNISFVGGIHGVGKSTICKQICKELNFEYLSASELIKWAEMNFNTNDKRVFNILDTQERLIIGLQNIIQKRRRYILDGHYCLINCDNKIENIPIETFIQINPSSFNLILGDITEIKSRIGRRDKQEYDNNLLETMQKEEENYAKFLSETLKVPLNTVNQNDYSKLIDVLKNNL